MWVEILVLLVLAVLAERAYSRWAFRPTAEPAKSVDEDWRWPRGWEGSE